MKYHITTTTPRPPSSLYDEYKRHARPLVLDGLLFLTTLGILLAAFAGLKILQAAGYPQQHIETLENIHFMAYAVITVAFAFDMVMKVLSIVVGRKK